MSALFRPETPAMGNVERLHERRNRIMAALERQGIATRPGSHAPVLTGYYARKYGLTADAFPSAYIADRLTLTLPLYAQLTDEEMAAVIDALTRGFEGA